MNNNYQPIYDAIRSKFNMPDMDSIIQTAFDFSHEKYQLLQAGLQAVSETTLPSYLFRPSLSMDGNKWCDLYGNNLQDGVAGFGNSPADAMFDFDINWHKKLEEINQ